MAQLYGGMDPSLGRASSVMKSACGMPLGVRFPTRGVYPDLTGTCGNDGEGGVIRTLNIIPACPEMQKVHVSV